MSFFGVDIQPKGDYKQVVPQFECLRITQAALSRTKPLVEGPTTLFFVKKDKKFAIAHLTPEKVEQVSLDYLFEPGEELVMEASGPNDISISGFRENLGEEAESDDDEFSPAEEEEDDSIIDDSELVEKEEEEEEPASPAPAPAPKKGKKEPKKAAEAPASPAAEVPCPGCPRKFKNAAGLVQHQAATGHGVAAASPAPAEAPARVIGKKRAPEGAVAGKAKKEKKEEETPAEAPAPSPKKQPKAKKAPAPAATSPAPATPSPKKQPKKQQQPKQAAPSPSPKKQQQKGKKGPKAGKQ
ncbi:hypothetical protein PAPYR_4384 [Paratrimastix pyriformis]|uniref:C2H2-type domain-containing protein n=1 Tax=Paratrimastix pyriformis TaxID=342808 RepID=A0ABQ8UMF1_9EUKA|nr:hypothetical protein PAPYR_4384 [Paratrimastix pyriformis]|eukprot:GAFH01002938.1.p1 GENE.GAFH01002938.1~~GAFH01002938.1.p1  ORF type:complete len:298 (-),score=168.68 GAFH01002938.1:137-1030(-)